jgi:hypothetical protein
MNRLLRFAFVLAIGYLLSAIAPPRALAQFAPDIQQVSVNAAGGLLGPVTFFSANSNRIYAIIGTSNLIANLAAKAGLTNAAMVTPTITGANLAGTTVVPSGAGINLVSGSGLSVASGSALVAAAGSTVVMDQLILAGSVTNRNSQYAATRAEVDYQSPGIVNDLAALRALPVATFLHRIVYVRNSTSGNGAAGAWIWDYASTWSESVVIQKSDTLDPGFAGRWLHL